MNQVEAIGQAYHIIAELIQIFIVDWLGCQYDDDRQVMTILEELRQHCEDYSQTLQHISEKEADMLKNRKLEMFGTK